MTVGPVRYGPIEISTEGGGGLEERDIPTEIGAESIGLTHRGDPHHGPWKHRGAN